MGKKREKRKLKPYEIAENVIDLDAFVAYHTGIPEVEDLIIFDPDDNNFDVDDDYEFMLILDESWVLDGEYDEDDF